MKIFACLYRNIKMGIAYTLYYILKWFFNSEMRVIEWEEKAKREEDDYYKDQLFI